MTMPRGAETAAVVGGGPAGLMAATVLSRAGFVVDLFDAKPTVGRKFLVAGRGGLNLTHAEPLSTFVQKYGPHAARFQSLLTGFSPDDLRAHVTSLGEETFVGTSGLVFPRSLRSTPLLRAWLLRLREQGVRFHPRRRWIGFAAGGGLVLDMPDGKPDEIRPAPAVLALGGASYPHLGSDGKWADILRARSIEVRPFKPSNCGFHADWSPALRERCEGRPLKNLRLTFAGRTVDGELVVTRYGIEGGGVYVLSPLLRDAIEQDGRAVLHVDLKRDLAVKEVEARLVKRPRGKASFANHLRKTLRLAGPVPMLLRELLSQEERNDPARLAAGIKRLPIPLIGMQPVEKAISSAGGIDFGEVNEDLMLEKLPGIFVAGEMLDYEAPTGGYLLQAAFSTGVRAGEGVVRWLRSLS